MDFVKFRIDDDSTNVIFRGYIVDKKFTHNTLNVTAKGIGIKLEWKGFNHNYVLAEGKVSAPIPYDGGDIPFTNYIYADTDTAANWQSTEANHWESVQYVESTEYISVVDGDENNVEEFDLGTLTGVTSATDIDVMIYGRYYGAAIDCTVDFDDGTGYIGAQAVGLTATYAWHTINFVVDPMTQAEVNECSVKLIAPGAIGLDPNAIRIDAIKILVTYTGSSVNALGLKQDDPDNDDPMFTWDIGQWYEAGAIDNGLLIVDNTSGMTTRNWSATAVNDNGTANNESGDHTKLTDKSGANYWTLTETDQDEVSVTAYVNLGGAVIDNVNKLKAIRISLHTALYQYEWGSPVTSGTLVCQIKKDTSWIDLFELSKTYSTGSGAHYAWYGIGIDGEGDLVDDIVIEDTDAELQKFFDVDGADDYDELKGFRFVLTGEVNNLFGNIVGIVVNYINVAIDFHTYDISPIMIPIEQNGATYIYNSSTTWDETGVGEDDYFKIGENTTQIAADVAADSGLNIRIDSTLTKYIARWYKGTYCIDIIKDICQLEGLHWWEDYLNDEIVLAGESDFVDSTVDLTNADCLWGWKIHDLPNQVKQVNVFGNAALRIYAFARDINTANISPIEKNIMNDKILTIPDAQEIADEKLLELKTKRLQIEIPLQGLNTNLTVGKTIDFDIDNPDIDATFPISKIRRTKGGYISTDDIWTTVYMGLGSTDLDEFIIDSINDINSQARRNAQDRLSSTPYSTSGASIQWGDIGGATAAVNALIAAATNYDDELGIGIANKRWISCIATLPSAPGKIEGATTLRNVDGTDLAIQYALPLPLVIGSKNLIITQTKVGILDADEGDEVDYIRWYGWTDHDSSVLALDSGVGLDLDAAQTYTWDHADTTFGGVYVNVIILAGYVFTNARDYDQSFMQVEYYYG